MGKTAFAIQLAHRVAPDFEDGQIVVFLGGQRPPDETLALLVRALTANRRIKARSHGQRARLFQELTSLRRILFVFDDVTDIESLQDLWPSGSRCAVITTTRAETLVVPGQALDLLLGPLPPEEAATAFEEIAGKDRVEADPDAADRLVSLTKGHPLSVVTAAASLVARPHEPLSTVVDRLSAAELASGSPERSLDVAYSLLSPDEQRALLAIGIIDRERFQSWELAAVLGAEEAASARLADQLASGGFISRDNTDSAGFPQFLVHRHVQIYAASRAAEQATAEAIAEARGRIQHRARERREIASDSVRREVIVPVEEGRVAAAIVAAMTAIGVARELHNETAEGLALAAFAEVRGELGDFGSAEEMARSATAPRLASASSQAWALRTLGRLKRRLHQTEAAMRMLQSALKHAQGDSSEEIRVSREIALAQVQREGPKKYAARHTISQAIGRANREGRAYLLAGLHCAAADVFQELGEMDRAEEAIREGRSHAEKHRQQLWSAWLMHRQARLSLPLGRLDEGLQAASDAASRFVEIGHRYGRAHSRLLVGQFLLLKHKPAEARLHLEKAGETFSGCGDNWAFEQTMKLLSDLYQAESVVRGRDQVAESTRSDKSLSAL
jgi:hypothetical protein